jgi:hypothetical protein
MKHKPSNWKVALPIIALACLVVLPQAIQAQEDTQVYLPLITSGQTAADGYTVVDTGQTKCYSNNTETACSQEGQAFYGQDAQYAGVQPSYVDNSDGTVTDLNTGLMWQKTPGDKVTYAEAVAGADTFNLAGYDDWRLPTIKELYSLIDFSGVDPSGWNGSDTSGLVPFIDTDYFDFEYGGTGERIIDAQYWSSTEYVGTTMNGSATTFGVNFADGRIKGYSREFPGGGEMTQFVRYVRGNTDYGTNDFVDNGDGTITDQATGLMWMKADSGMAMNWQEALNYCESLEYAGYDDWRLPNAKELQSIVDYSRSPDTTGSAAIDPLFSVTAITNEAGQADYPFYWSSTTHANFANGMNAAYVTFGRALGYMNNTWIDVHGAGAQRSDPKSGDPADWPTGHGPQGDAIRIYNYARCVRGGDVTLTPDGDSTASRAGLTVESTGSSQPMQPGGQPGPGGQPPNGNQQPGVMPGQPSQSGPGGQPPQPSVQPGQQNGQSGQPPQEAIAACSGLSENATCQVITPQGTLSGTCMLVQSQLACVPQGGPPPGAP